METLKLNKSRVRFVEDGHDYYWDGVKISGVTPIVNWMYPRTYEDISESVMKAAAAHGTAVHKDCQLYDCGIDQGTPETTAYARLKAENGLITAYNEWLVDDGGNVASSIDVIFTDGSICDIKTTSKIHVENVTLQLSIYAYLLERMNPGFTVPRMCVIWLPKKQYGKPSLMWLSRIEPAIIETVIADYLAGKPNDNALSLLGNAETGTLTKLTDGQMATIRDAERQIASIERTVKQLSEQESQLRSGLLELFERYGVTKWDGDEITMSYRAESTRETVDTSRLKKEQPEIYNQYIKKSTVKSSLQIKLKDGKIQK